MSNFKFDTNQNFLITNEVFKGLQDAVNMAKSYMATFAQHNSIDNYFLKRPTSEEDGFVMTIGGNQSVVVTRILKGTYASSDKFTLVPVKKTVKDDTGTNIVDFIEDSYFEKANSGIHTYSDWKDLPKTLSADNVKRSNRGYVQVKGSDGSIQKGSNTTGVTVSRVNSGQFLFDWNAKASYFVLNVLPDDKQLGFTWRWEEQSDGKIKIFFSTSNPNFIITYENYD